MRKVITVREQEHGTMTDGCCSQAKVPASSGDGGCSRPTSATPAPSHGQPNSHRCGCQKSMFSAGMQRLSEAMPRMPSMPSIKAPACLAHVQNPCAAMLKCCHLSDKTKDTLKQCLQTTLLAMHTVLLVMLLIVYYLAYSYVMMVYYILKSIVFFHEADGAMKVTMGITTLTGLIVGLNVTHKLERMLRLR